MNKTMFGDKRQEIIGWIEECKSLNSLQRIRTKLNKRIKSLQYHKPHNPLNNIDIEKKREVLKPLLTEEDTEVAKGVKE